MSSIEDRLRRMRGIDDEEENQGSSIYDRLEEMKSGGKSGASGSGVVSGSDIARAGVNSANPPTGVKRTYGSTLSFSDDPKYNSGFSMPNTEDQYKYRSLYAGSQADKLEEERRALLLPMQSSQGATQSFSDIWGTMSQADELQEKINSLRQEEKEYRTKSETEGYQKLFLKPDFSSNSVRTQSARDKAIQNMSVDPVDERYLVGLEHANGVGSMEWIQRAKQLTNDELSVYNYLRNTEGQESADKFLDYMEETLNQRLGGKKAEGISNIENPVGKFLATGGYGLLSGVDQFGGGVRQLFSEEALPTTYTQFGAAQVREDLSDVGPKLGSRSLGQAAFEGTQMIGNMLPSIAIGSIAGGAGISANVAKALGSGALGASAGGNAYNEAIKQGYSPEQAQGYGTLVALSEGGLSYLLGGISALGGKVSGKIISKTIQNISNAFLRAGVGLGLSAFSEGVEEYAQEVINPMLRNIALDENNPVELVSEEAIYSGIMGALSAGLFEGPSRVTDAVSDVRTNQELRSIDRSYADMQENGIFGQGPRLLPTAGSVGREGTTTAGAWYDRNVGPEPGGSTGTQAQKNASTGEAVTHRMTMEDFTDVNSPVWNNVEYGDTETQSRITRQTHQAMVEEGAVVTVPEGTMERVGQSYPDLRGMKKAERTPILRQKMKELKASLRQFLNGLKGGKYEFNVNGNILEARLYDTGVREVLEKIDRSKASMLYHSDQVFRNARYLYSTPDYDGDPNVYRWNYFYTPVQIGDEIVGVRIAVRDMVRQTDGSMDSQIYNWGIKTGAALDGGERGNMPDRSDVSSAAPDGMTLGTSASSVNPSMSSIPQSGAENNINTEQGGPRTLPTASDAGPDSSVGAAQYGFGQNTVGAAENPYGYRQEKSKVGSNTFSKMYRELLSDMDENSGNVTELPYDVVTERQSIEHAQQRLFADLEGEISVLPNKDAWSGEDLDTAMGILDRYMAEAKDSRDYTKVNEWARLIQSRGTTGGQFIQAFAKYTRTPQGILVDAVKALDNSKLSEARKAEVMSHVQEQVEMLDSLEDGDKDAVISLIRRNSEIRRTGSLIRNRISKTLESAMKADSYDHLKKVAAAQVDSIAKDYESKHWAEYAKSVRSMFMLSNLTTVLRNLVGNSVFDPVDSLAGSTIVVPLDILLSKYTGTRSVSVENPFSKTKRKGAIDGLIKSYIEVALDANASGVESRYEQTSNRTFKMTGNPFERFLSAWSKYQGYALNTTDEMSKGGIRAETQRGVDALKDRGLISDDSLDTRGDDMAKYRTFQDDSTLSKLMLSSRNALNYAGVGPAKGGSPHSFGLGDLINPFARVPANLVSRAGDYSPIGLANGARELIGVLKKAHNGKLTASEQARAISAIGRGVTGTGLIAIFGALSAAGLLRVAGNGDGEEDKTALEASEGISGTQLNLSAAIRWISGEENATEWRKGDELISIGFLEPINAQMTTGALLAQELSENNNQSMLGKAEIFAKASLEGTLQSLLDLPAMSGLQDIAAGYRYSDSETVGGRIADAAISYGAGQVSSFIPNMVRAAARASDPYIRDAYTSGNTVGEIVDNIKMSLPGLRQTLPIKQSPFGEDRSYGDNQAMNALNALLLPGSINTYRTTDAAQELYSLPKVEDTPVYPRRSAPETISYDETDYSLSAEDKTRYQKTYGQTYKNVLESLISNNVYQESTPEERAEMANMARAYAGEAAKAAFLKSRKVDYTPDGWIGGAMKSGVPTEHYLTYRYTADANGDDTVSQVESAGALLPIAGLTDEQKGRIWQSQNTSWSEKKNPFTGALPKAGIEPETAVGILQRYSDIDNDSYSGDSVPRQKQTALSKYLDTIDLSKNERAVVDDTYKFFNMFPASVIPYSIDTMSDAAQEKWPRAQRWGMNEEDYLKYYPICTAGGKKKDEIIRDLVNAGMTRQEAFQFWNIVK